MQHEALLELVDRFPDNFHYYPVLTREWPSEWPYGKGRMIRVSGTGDSSRCIDLAHLLEVVPDLDQCHLRMCGNARCRDEIVQGLQQYRIEVLSFRSEVW